MAEAAAKVVLGTGASSGFGKPCADQLLPQSLFEPVLSLALAL